MRALIYIMTPVLILTVIIAIRFVTWEELKGVDKQAFQHLTNGTQFLRNGKNRQAISSFTKAIEIEPRYAEAYIKRGFAYYQLTHYQKAIADYTHTLNLKRFTADAYAGRGDIYLALSDPQRALADYTASLAERKNASVMLKRARIYFDTGRMDEAIKEYTYVIKRRPTALAYYNRGRVYQAKSLLSNHKDDLLIQALADFDKAINIQQHFAIAYLSRGDIHSQLGQKYLKESDYKQTVNLLTDAIQNWQQEMHQLIPIYMWRAVAYHRQKNNIQSEKDIVRCYELIFQFYLKKVRISYIL